MYQRPMNSSSHGRLSRRLLRLYRLMENHFGPTHWWPGDTPFEIALGAILTQNTAWTHVEKAIGQLKHAGLMHPQRLLDAPVELLEKAVRPSGYYRQKAERLRAFTAYLVNGYGGSMKRMALRDAKMLRRELLAIKGIGPETADDILLYACGKPVFVVDTYTRRMLSRHGIADEKSPYESLRGLFEGHLPHEVALFQEYHGLIVFTGKDFCRGRPRCEDCPLLPDLAASNQEKNREKSL